MSDKTMPHPFQWKSLRGSLSTSIAVGELKEKYLDVVRSAYDRGNELRKRLFRTPEAQNGPGAYVVGMFGEQARRLEGVPGLVYPRFRSVGVN